MLEGLIKSRGSKHKLVLLDDPRDLTNGQYDFSDVAVVLLTHVSYCTGRMLDMPALTSGHTQGVMPLHFIICSISLSRVCFAS